MCPTEVPLTAGDGQPSRRRPRALVAVAAPGHDQIRAWLPGCDVDTAHDGADALARVQQASYEVAIVDVDDPRMGGPASLRGIRRVSDSGPRLSVIAISSDVGAVSRARCYEAGADSVLAAPIEPADFLEVVAACLGPGDGLDAGTLPAPAGRGFDPAELIERVGGDAGAARDLVAIFRAQWPGMWARVGACQEGGDTTSLARAAHALKGTLGSMGAVRAYEAALALQLAAREGDVGRAAQAARRLGVALASLDEAFAHWAEGDE